MSSRPGHTFTPCRPPQAATSISSHMSWQRPYVASYVLFVCVPPSAHQALALRARHVAAHPPASAAASASDGASVSTLSVVPGRRHVYRRAATAAVFAPSIVDPSPSSSAVRTSLPQQGQTHSKTPPPAALFVHHDATCSQPLAGQRQSTPHATPFQQGQRWVDDSL